jgi:hypothetical protein
MASAARPAALISALSPTPLRLVLPSYVVHRARKAAENVEEATFTGLPEPRVLSPGHDSHDSSVFSASTAEVGMGVGAVLSCLGPGVG